MPKDPAIAVNQVSKCYQIYAQPIDRLKQGLWNLLPNRWVGGKYRRYYQEFWALRAVDFAIQPGETLGIVGRNGAGKSTLLQILCGTLQPTTGAVSVQGKVAALLELGAGFNPEFTGRENVYLCASLYGLSRAEIKAKFAAIAAFADIGDFIEQPVKTYSSGMFVRLAFAVIVHVDADILVIDEALAVGDAFFTQKCMRFLRGFKEQGGTLLFVSHDPAAVLSLCDRAILLEAGRVTKMGAARPVVEFYLQSLHEAGAKPVEAIPTVAEDQTVQELVLDSRTFGEGGALITAVRLLREDGSVVTSTLGEELVRLELDFVTKVPIKTLLTGLQIKDRYGQSVLGANSVFTDVTDTAPIAAGQTAQVIFTFRLPVLRAGDYVVTVALGDGNQNAHVMHHWIHDVLAFRAVNVWQDSILVAPQVRIVYCPLGVSPLPSEEPSPEPLVV